MADNITQTQFKVRDLLTKKPFTRIMPDGHYDHGYIWNDVSEVTIPQDTLRRKIVTQEDFFSKKEYEEFLKFSSNVPSEYIPDIITEFCREKGIDEYERTIGTLAYNFEKREHANYNMWESKILNRYYDAIYENHNPFEFGQSSL